MLIQALAARRQERIRQVFPTHLRAEFPEYASELSNEVAQQIFDGFLTLNELQSQVHRASRWRRFFGGSMSRKEVLLQRAFDEAEREFMSNLQGLAPRFHTWVANSNDGLSSKRWERIVESVRAQLG